VIDLTQETIRHLFSYDAETGDFAWKVQKSRNIKLGEPIKANKITGYRCVKINKKTYPVHRLIWLYLYGHWPHGDIDHKNRIRSDNRLCNLRDVSRTDNCQNITLPSHNKSGHIGISWVKSHKSWTVYIKVDKKNKWLGYYKDINQAIAARKKGESTYYNLPDIV
jgi:hypothetical protein